MPKTLEPGPYRHITTSDGSKAPWYVMPFDKRGVSTAPRTRAHLLNEIESGGYTDVFLFSHGWNNDWSVAMERYEHFLAGFIKMRRDHSLNVPRNYKPLLVGVIWPSTALVLPWERAPRFAAIGISPEAEMDADVGDEREIVNELAEAIDESKRERFYELVQCGEGLAEAEALELAEMLLDVGTEDQAELPLSQPPSAADLVAAWREAQSEIPRESNDDSPLEDDDFGTFDGEAEAPQVAGVLSSLDPRNVVRMASVLQMKDRAGVVGGRGVSKLLTDLLAIPNAEEQLRVHLVGHSYGAKVVLSALCSGDHSRKVASVLLLQPAISRLCFAEDAGRGQAGGYRSALNRSALPIMSTFSRKDMALTRFFHLAARRRSDQGELRIAAGGEPSRFAALGGFGPGNLGPEENAIVKMKSVGDNYDLNHVNEPVVSLEGHEAIHGHGDISNPYTWWALFNAVKAS